MRFVDWPLDPKADLSVEDDDLMVDIGHLADEKHRQAFVEIFEAVIRANWSRLSEYDSIELAQDRMAIDKLSSEAPKLAGRLYDRLVDKAGIRLVGKGRQGELVVGFDNPYFSLVPDVSKRTEKLEPRWKRFVAMFVASYALGLFTLLLYAFPQFKRPRTSWGWVVFLIVGPPAAVLFQIACEWIGGHFFSERISRSISKKRFSWARILYGLLFMLAFLAALYPLINWLEKWV